MFADEDALNTDTVTSTPSDGDSAVTPVEEGSEDTSVQAITDEARTSLDTPEVEGAPVTDTSVADPVAPVNADQTAIPAKGFLDALRDEGIEPTYTDDSAAAKAFAEMRRKLSERDEYSRLGQAIAPEYDEFIAYKANKGQGQAVEQQDEPAWNPPEFNPQWLNEALKPENERDPVVVDKLNKYTEYTADRWSQWMQNPQQMVQDLVAPLVEEKIQAYQKDVTAKTEIDSIISQNEEICTKYQQQILTLVNEHNVPFEASVQLMKQQEELNKLKAGPATPTTIPAAPTGNTPQAVPSGVVEQPQTPPRAETQDDVERWQDPAEAAKDAMRSLGMQPRSPASIE